MLARRKSRAHPCEDAPSSVGRQLLAKAGYRQCAWTGAKHTLDRRQIAQRIDIDVIQQDGLCERHPFQWRRYRFLK
jgi:hypothetical protein